MPRLHVIVQRYVPRWVIEIALVAAAVQIYRQTLDLRSRVLNQPIMVRLLPGPEPRSGTLTAAAVRSCGWRRKCPPQAVPGA